MRHNGNTPSRHPNLSGRLLVLSPFPDAVRLASAATALQRNRLMCELADEIVVAHARAGGQLERLVKAWEGEKRVERW